MQIRPNNYILILMLLMSCIMADAQDTIPVPDTSFRNYLKEHHSNVLDSNNELITSKAANVTDKFDCSGRNIKDLTGIQYFKSIPELQASENQISYIPSLDSLSEVQEIELHGNQLDSIPDLSELTTLEELYIDKNSIDSVPGLAHLKNLKHLDISRNNIKALPDLDALKQLITFHCFSNALSTLPSLDSLKKLEKLYCFDNELTSFPSLSNLDSLRELSFGGNRIDSFPALTNNTQLRILAGWSNRLKSFPEINHLNYLRVLNLGNNRLTSLPSVNNLDSLRELYCDNNRLENLPDISNLQQLERLICHNNNLNAFPDLSGRDSLDTVTVHNNKLSFDDFIPNTNHPAFDSVFGRLNQDSLGKGTDITREQMDTLKVRLSFDSNITSSTYTWYYNGEKIATTDSNALWVDSLDYTDAGNYYCEIENSTSGLQNLTLHSKKQHVDIISCIHTNNLKTEVVNNCPPSATVVVDSTSIYGGKSPYTFELKSSNGRVIQGVSNRFEDLSAGSYHLHIDDNSGCYTTLTNAITINSRGKDCANVLSPDGDGLNDVYHIEQQGTAKIYNRHGKLIRTLKTPAEWNGMTDGGKTATTGQYIIKIDGEVVKVTVVR